MNFVPDDLNLPLFLLSRQRFKNAQRYAVQRYFNKQHWPLPHRACQKSNNDAGAKKPKHMPCLYPPNSTACPVTVSSSRRPDLIKSEPWHQSPNRYQICERLTANHGYPRGINWAKSCRKKPRTRKPLVSTWKSDSMSQQSTGLPNRCLNPSLVGAMSFNARNQRPVARSMIFDNAAARDSDMPSSADYYPRHHEMATRIGRKVKLPVPNPHIFLRNSCVPVSPNSIHAKNTSFLPGPGRYETSIRETCPCKKGKIYFPQLQFIVDRQKRLKFRRLPYLTIRKGRYCDPEWRHVKGHGFRHLFRNMPPHPVWRNITTQEDTKAMIPRLAGTYLYMINNPESHREPLSIRTEAAPQKKSKLRFNCVVKVSRRRHVTSTRVAFNSSRSRFDTQESMMTGSSRLEAIKKRCSKGETERSRSIIRLPKEEVKSKFMEVPKHMKVTFEIPTRKKLFKFLPLPEPKTLVDFETIQLPAKSLSRFYEKPINIEDFLKDDCDLSQLPELGI